MNIAGITIDIKCLVFYVLTLVSTAIWSILFIKKNYKVVNNKKLYREITAVFFLLTCYLGSLAFGFGFNFADGNGFSIYNLFLCALIEPYSIIPIVFIFSALYMKIRYKVFLRDDKILYMYIVATIFMVLFLIYFCLLAHSINTIGMLPLYLD